MSPVSFQLYFLQFSFRTCFWCQRPFYMKNQYLQQYWRQQVSEIVFLIIFSLNLIQFFFVIPNGIPRFFSIHQLFFFIKLFSLLITFWLLQLFWVIIELISALFQLLRVLQLSILFLNHTLNFVWLLLLVQHHLSFRIHQQMQIQLFLWTHSHCSWCFHCVYVQVIFLKTPTMTTFKLESCT